MSRNGSDGGRQDPFRSLRNEPVEDMITGVVPPVLQQRPRMEQSGSRRSAVRPTEQRRRRRAAHITFSCPTTVSRLRALAQKWGWRSNNDRPNVSRVVEYLLLPQIEAAEREEIRPPTDEEQRKASSLGVSEKESDGQWF
jgi:hypothetical protein